MCLPYFSSQQLQGVLLIGINCEIASLGWWREIRPHPSFAISLPLPLTFLSGLYFVLNLSGFPLFVSVFNGTCIPPVSSFQQFRYTGTLSQYQYTASIPVLLRQYSALRHNDIFNELYATESGQKNGATTSVQHTPCVAGARFTFSKRLLTPCFPGNVSYRTGLRVLTRGSAAPSKRSGASPAPVGRITD